MKGKKLEVVRGSGNVFADLRIPNASVEQLKALLAAKIIAALDYKALSVRAAAAKTGIAAADFSRIRTVKLDRFTVDRLMNTLERLDQMVEVKVTVKPIARAERRALV